MGEKTFEKRLRDEVKKMGGLALKIYSLSFSGLPDRLILHDGRAVFCELKSEGEKPRKRQEIVHKILLSLGFKVWVVDSNETLEKLLTYLRWS